MTYMSIYEYLFKYALLRIISKTVEQYVRTTMNRFIIYYVLFMLQGAVLAEHEMCNMFLAIERMDLEMFSSVLEHNPELVNLYDPTGCTALCRVVSVVGGDEDLLLEFVKRILKVEGLDIDMKCMRDCHGSYIDACGRNATEIGIYVAQLSFHDVVEKCQ